MKARCGLGRQRLAGRAIDRYERAPVGAKIAALPQPHDTVAQRASAFRACRDEKLLSIGQAEKEKRSANNKPPSNSEITLTTDQIFNFCDLLCKKYPEKIPGLLEIVQRNILQK